MYSVFTGLVQILFQLRFGHSCSLQYRPHPAKLSKYRIIFTISFYLGIKAVKFLNLTACIDIFIFGS